VAVSRSKAVSYRAVAENFFQGADVARQFEYWNAAGVLIVHAAIAYADAISIRLGSVKSRGEDHHETIALLEELLTAGEERRKALHQLRRIIDQKNAVSYSGEIYRRKDVEELWKLASRFREWAIQVLD
jgi:HEPN domain-containing protein